MKADLDFLPDSRGVRAPILRCEYEIRSMKRLTIETKIQIILADPEGRRVLSENLPGLVAHPSLNQMSNMSLRQLAHGLRGAIPANVLAKTQHDLAQIK